MKLVTFEKFSEVERSDIFYYTRKLLGSGDIIKFRYPQGRGLDFVRVLPLMLLVES